MYEGSPGSFSFVQISVVLALGWYPATRMRLALADSWSTRRCAMFFGFGLPNDFVMAARSPPAGETMRVFPLLIRWAGTAVLLLIGEVRPCGDGKVAPSPLASLWILSPSASRERRSSWLTN